MTILWYILSLCQGVDHAEHAAPAYNGGLGTDRQALVSGWSTLPLELNVFCSLSYKSAFRSHKQPQLLVNGECGLPMSRSVTATKPLPYFAAFTGSHLLMCEQCLLSLATHNRSFGKRVFSHSHCAMVTITWNSKQQPLSCYWSTLQWNLTAKLTFHRNDVITTLYMQT